MELRAHHPETFWTKLALAGVNNIQIGVEFPFPPGFWRKWAKGPASIRTSRPKNT